MRVEFVKMQGLGNDFLVFDAAALASDTRLDSGLLRALADRHTGVGFDQALMLETPRDAHSRVFYRVFNSDGTEVEQCGNGARCIAALLYTRAPQLGRELTLGSSGGTVLARVRDDGLVSVDMGVPNFDPRCVPLQADAQADIYSLMVEDAELKISALSMGNPHVVLCVPDVKTAAVERLGLSIQRHPRLPKSANVGFMQTVNRSHIKLRVFERGAGETLACGTGACAAVAVGKRLGLLDGEVRVDLPGGTAQVSWTGPDRHIWLTGPATTVYTGFIDLTRFTGAKQ